MVFDAATKISTITLIVYTIASNRIVDAATRYLLVRKYAAARDAEELHKDDSRVHHACEYKMSQAAIPEKRGYCINIFVQTS